MTEAREKARLAHLMNLVLDCLEQPLKDGEYTDWQHLWIGQAKKENCDFFQIIQSEAKRILWESEGS
jgi:hypothetical protein